MSNPSDPLSSARHDEYPLSPQSPSTTGTDPRRMKTFPSTQPQQPTSPTHSSSASVTASTAASPPYLAAFTPPSSVPMSAQTSQTSLSAGQFPTNAARSNLQLDASQTSATAAASDSTSMDIDSEAARPKRKLDETEDAETTPGKRTKLDEAQPDEQPTQKPEKPDFGPLYCLRSTEYSASRPHANQNLISLYSLDGIASSVARFDPHTGAKINRIRQSYEGYLKHLPGRAKLSGKKDKDDKKKSAEEDSEPVLWNVLQMPDEEYHIQRVAGRDISKGVPEDTMADLMSKLESATRMNVGRLPEPEDGNWKHIVTSGPAETKTDRAKESGHDKGKEQAGKANSQAGLSATGSPTTSALNSPTDGDSTRARRNAKRRYNDDSYEGYGEGYEDDEGDAHSPDDGDDPTNSVRRKKRKSTASSPRYPSFSGTYKSSSTVSVGYGSR